MAGKKKAGSAPKTRLLTYQGPRRTLQDGSTWFEPGQEYDLPEDVAKRYKEWFRRASKKSESGNAAAAEK